MEPITKLAFSSPLPKVIIQSKKEVVEKAIKDNSGLILWTDSLKLEQGQVAAAVYWEERSTTKWKEKNMFLGKNK